MSRAERRPRRSPEPRSPPEGRPATAETDDRPHLRLAMSRGGLGLELDRPFALGPLRVERLAERLEGLRYPLDLSEGVPRFRHRRGLLVELSLALDTAALARSLAPRLREVLGEAAELRLDPTADGVRLGASWGEAAIAADLVLAHAEPERLLLVPAAARGLGLPAPPRTLVLQMLQVLGRPVATAVGGALVVERPLARIARDVLPLAGGRVPQATGVVLRIVPPSGEALELEAFDLGASPLSERVLSLLELRGLTAAADDALLANDLERARGALLEALERAPRHPEIVERIAWIDLHAGRALAAISLLVDVRAVTAAGLLGGELLARTGDRDGAYAAFSAAAATEPFGPLAARAWLRAAELAPDARARLDALDEARARAPSLRPAHWARLDAFAALGDAKGALAAAQELEAATRGASDRRATWLRAARALAAHGFAREATGAFERALRYAPDDAAATRGLAEAARELGDARRALDLLRRAASLEERAGQPTDETICALAEGLADLAEDLPAAIARVRSVRPDGALAPRARRLEALYLSRLGDGPAALVALARLGEAVERRGPRGLPAGPGADADAAVHGELDLGARLAEELGDRALAKRLAGLALRLAPRDKATLGLVRRLGEGEQPKPQTVDPEARAAELEERLRADPADERVARELAALLEELGRDHELIALASARLEEGVSPALSAELAGRRRSALARLAATARAGGRETEAHLYDDLARQ